MIEIERQSLPRNGQDEPSCPKCGGYNAMLHFSYEEFQHDDTKCRDCGFIHLVRPYTDGSEEALRRRMEKRHAKMRTTEKYITGRQYDPPGPDAREQELVITYTPFQGDRSSPDAGYKEPVHMVDATRGITYDLLVPKMDCTPGRIGPSTLYSYDNLIFAPAKLGPYKS